MADDISSAPAMGDWHTPGSLDDPYGTDGLGEQGGAVYSNDYLGSPLWADPGWLNSMGFDGNSIDYASQPDMGMMPQASDEYNQWMNNKNLQLQTRQQQGLNNFEQRYVDGLGNPVGLPRYSPLDTADRFGIVGNLLMGVASGGASAAGLGSMGSTVGSAVGASGAAAAPVGNAVMGTAMGSVANGGHVGDAAEGAVMSAGTNGILQGLGAPISSAASDMTGGTVGEGSGYFGSNFGGNALSALMDIYKYTQANKGLGSMMSGLQSLYKPDNAYAQQLRQQLERKDAAAGRRSQYGPREVELQARLAGMATPQIPAMMNLQNQMNTNRNSAINQAMVKYAPMAMHGLQGLYDKYQSGQVSNGSYPIDQSQIPQQGQYGSYQDSPFQAYDNGLDSMYGGGQ